MRCNVLCQFKRFQSVVTLSSCTLQVKVTIQTSVCRDGIDLPCCLVDPSVCVSLLFDHRQLKRRPDHPWRPWWLLFEVVV